MELFDVLKAFFVEKKWQEVSKQDKARNFFMINRMMGIQYPLQSNALNNTKIDPVSAVDYWRSMLVLKYKTAPGWFFTSSTKKDKIKAYSPPDEISSFIRSKYEVSEREIKELSKYYPKEFKKYCDTIKDLVD
jgi:hypothetical protein